MTALGLRLGAYRTLWRNEAADYAAHLKRLSPADRRLRFHSAMTDGALDQHAAAAIARADVDVIGWFAGGVLRGAAEVAVFKTGEATEAEAAFAVEAPWRGRGVGADLMHRAALHAQNLGARRLHIATEIENAPMLRLAQNSGADFTISDREADGVLIQAPRTVFSICLETFEEELGVLAWAWERLMLRLRGTSSSAPAIGTAPPAK